ncbi:MAG: flagellar hook-basal body complex protein, partial [Candidatus Coatesbacteria bacterium]|nr:flagellar hook-basal body complex protein [Candidatus Coatesbacteria bacterium]
ATYTRAGHFRINDEGYLATSDGYRLSPPISIDGDIDSVRVSGDGTVWGKNSQTGQVEEFGRLQLTKFPDPSALKPIGNGRYVQTSSSGNPTWGAPGTGGLGSIAYGQLEMSNVDLVSEVVNQTLAQRGAEANIKSIQTGNEMVGSVLDLVE